MHMLAFGIIKLGLTLCHGLSQSSEPNSMELTSEIQQPSPSVTQQRDDPNSNSTGPFASHPTLRPWA